jgi:hypothetical protein
MALTFKKIPSRGISTLDLCPSRRDRHGVVDISIGLKKIPTLFEAPRYELLKRYRDRYGARRLQVEIL